MGVVILTSDEFLLLEYDKCFELLKFYDQRQGDLQKQIYSISISATIAQFALFEWFGSATPEFMLFLSALAFVVFMSCIAIYFGMISNRLYFVVVAKQLNAIRAHYILGKENKFQNKQMYLSTEFSAAKPISVQSMMLVSAALVISIFLGETFYAALSLFSCDSIVLAVLASAAFSLLLIGGSLRFLHRKSTVNADDAIHG